MFKFNIPKRWDQWAKALVAAGVSGFSSSILAALGASAGSAIGLQVHQFDLRQLIDLGLSGGAISALAYLKQSPVPPDSTGNTEIINKNQSPQ